MKTFFVLLLVLVIHLLSNFSMTTKAQNLVQETCKKTKYSNLCVSTLKSDPRSSRADVKGLARIALDKVLDKAKKAANIFLELYKNHSSDPTLGRFYGSCVDTYSGLVDRLLPEAIRSLKSNDYENAKTDSENVVSNAQLCEQLFDKSPAYKQSTFIQQLSTDAADIISTLE